MKTNQLRKYKRRLVCEEALILVAYLASVYDIGDDFHFRIDFPTGNMKYRGNPRLETIVHAITSTEGGDVVSWRGQFDRSMITSICKTARERLETKQRLHELCAKLGVDLTVIDTTFLQASLRDNAFPEAVFPAT